MKSPQNTTLHSGTDFAEYVDSEECFIAPRIERSTKAVHHFRDCPSAHPSLLEEAA